MRQALASGLRGQDAAKEAGAPPFKARDLTESARRFKARDLSLAFSVLAEADLALKGSRTPPDVVLEEALLRLCGGRPLGYRAPVRRRRR
jgi:DNA polymerase-3 subunit delta